MQLKGTETKRVLFVAAERRVSEMIRGLSSCVWTRGCRASGPKHDSGGKAPQDREAGRQSRAGADEGPGPRVLVWA